MTRNNWFFFKVLSFAVVTVLIVGLGLSATVFFVEGFSGAFSKDLCFSNHCVQNAFDIYSASVDLIRGMLSIVVATAMVGGIGVALQSYINNAQSNALSNHLSHISVFQSFLAQEIEKRPLVELSSVDIFKWYNRIFEESREGSTKLSRGYVERIKEINRAILESNKLTSNTSSEKFRYVEHQSRLIGVLEELGVRMSRAPRNEFYEVESQVLSLVVCVNREFCYSREVPEIMERRYL
ncbi:conserved hypothetical protein [Thioalkalivibrio sp. K90mix]|uniref:retron Ec48 family effector membrane protein n=1 Tax=unclassified Thioalkalivibrio TaxID=2621013 RepID=UPI000195A931|nr:MULTISPECIES: retron Ec48 family effector membrane protein [unclassified Thioalkalivibrio]ADC71943.1 conserved hypothetical protein [Thioalkalivibrio sp. K90mix]